MTNSYTDIRNAKTMIIMGGNPAEAHPVSLQHLLEGKEMQRANMIVIDPRMTRTAAHATEYVRIRPGTDIPVIYGMLWHIFKNGWEDKQFIEQRVYGMDDIRKEVEKYTPEEVERISGVPGAQLERVAKMFATEKPATLIWCMGATQHTVGTANVRAFCIALLATGNVGASGTGANIFRGHTNVQGATDLGLDIVTLPLYYGLVEGAWRHWSRVWEVPYDWFVDRFDKITGPDGKETNTMNTPGIPSTRWFDATLYDKKDVRQKDNIKAMFVMGHGGNTVTRMPQAQKGIEALDLLVVADPHPTTWAALAPARKNNTYLLPIATSYETAGLAHLIQPRDPVGRADRQADLRVEGRQRGDVSPRQEARLRRPDVQEHQGREQRAVAEDILREINRGGWSTGYCGQSPERLKSHMANQKDFDMLTQKATTGPNKGDYYGLPWPCWGTPEFKHPGTPLLYNTNLSIKEGGGTFRARFGVEREETLPDGSKRKVSLLGNGYYSKGSEIKDGYPEFTLGVLKKLGWDKDLTEAELAVINKVNPTTPDAVSWSIDLSGGIQRVAIEHGCIPYGNGKARANAFGLPDAIPTHREPIYTPRPELVAKYPTLPNAMQFRMPNVGFDVQKAAVEKGIAKQFPLILTSGRLVEYEGGGEETRSNKWLAELQQDMFIEINPADAAERGIKDGAWVWVTGAENDSKARDEGAGHRTRRQGRDLVSVPLRRLVPGRRSARQLSEGHRPGRAGRKRQRPHHLRLRPGHRHARTQSHPLSDQSGVRSNDHGTYEISLRRRSLHRMQRLRHRLQERERSARGASIAGASSPSMTASPASVRSPWPACTAPTRLARRSVR